MSDPKSKTRYPLLPIGIGAGVAIGVAIGSAFDNLGLGIAIGVALGVAFGMSRRVVTTEHDEPRVGR
ncbi:MAG: hypothetical protein ACJ8GV_08235 [Luteimonas sp.]